MQKSWEKKKNDDRRFDDFEKSKQDINKKKAKLKPVEKNKYRMKNQQNDDDEEVQF